MRTPQEEHRHWRQDRYKKFQEDFATWLKRQHRDGQEPASSDRAKPAPLPKQPATPDTKTKTRAKAK
ncbi:hypothetical protein DBR42_06545 [Pelomonas sp. HMWF004]|nr:hypothetical protein DBR42_06545 [Pelomonas sp. HMWF004]